jgi:hypothetical protein
MKKFKELTQSINEGKSINLASAFKQVLLKFDVENAYKDKKSISSPKGTELGKAISWIKTNYKRDASDLVAMIIDKKYRDDVLRAGEGQRNLKKLSRRVSESINEASTQAYNEKGAKSLIKTIDSNEDVLSSKKIKVSTKYGDYEVYEVEVKGGAKRNNPYGLETVSSGGKRKYIIQLSIRESVELDEAINEARADYKYNRTGQYNTKVTVCYISPITRMRACDDIWFKSRFDALGFKDNVKGFPKGAEVEAIKVMEEVAANSVANGGVDMNTTGKPKKDEKKPEDVFKR